MKVFVLLAVVAAACALPPTYFGGPSSPKSISFNPDGSIVVSVDNGAKKVVIHKKVGLDGEPEVDVSVSGPFINPQWWQFPDAPTPKENSIPEDADYTRDKRGSITKSKTKSQTDILTGILKDFTGPLDEPMYQKLLSKLNKAVMKGELSPSIYQIFQNLDQPTDATQSTEPSPWSQFLNNQGLNFAGQTVGQQYPGQQYPGQQYLGQQYPGEQYPGQQYPGQQYLGQQYPGQQYPGKQYPGQQYPMQPFFGPGQQNVTIPWVATKSAFVEYLRQQLAQQQLQQLIQQVLQEVQKAQQQQLAAQQALAYQPSGVYGQPQVTPVGDYPNYPFSGIGQVQSQPVYPGVGIVPQQRFGGFPYPGFYGQNYPIGGQY